MSPPNTPSLQLLSLNVNGLRGKQKQAALFATLQSGPWQVIALQETHHANQTEAAQWCREGAGPTAPWDGPSFWATGTSASRGVALLFKPSPLLSGATSAAVDPNGRFVAVRCDLSGSQITIASVYAPVERQERTPFFHSSLLPALPAGTPLALGGDWNCVASDQDLIGGQPGTRQAGFQHGLLPLQQALGLLGWQGIRCCKHCLLFDSIACIRVSLCSFLLTCESWQSNVFSFVASGLCLS